MTASPPVPHGLNIHESRQPECLAASIITYSLAVIAVGLRLWARRLMRTQYWVDDWLAVVTLIFSTGLIASGFVWIAQGYGQHLWVLGPDFVTNFFKNLFTGEILYALIICSAKFCILAFYWRLFRASIRIPCYIIGTITICWTIAVILVTIFQCKPVSGFWNRDKPAKCNVNDYAFFISIAVPNIVTDAALLILPMPYIWRLHRTTPQKIALAGIFMLGGFVTIISIVRLVTLINIDLKSPDLDYNFAMVGVWTITETNMAIVSACLPSHRPILNLLLYGKPNASAWDSSYGYSSTSGRSWPKLRLRPSTHHHHNTGGSSQQDSSVIKSSSEQNFVTLSSSEDIDGGGGGGGGCDAFSGAQQQSHAVVSVGERGQYEQEQEDIELQRGGNARDGKQSGIYVRSDVNVRWGPTS